MTPVGQDSAFLSHWQYNGMARTLLQSAWELSRKGLMIMQRLLGNLPKRFAHSLKVPPTMIRNFIKIFNVNDPHTQKKLYDDLVKVASTDISWQMINNDWQAHFFTKDKLPEYHKILSVARHAYLATYNDPMLLEIGVLKNDEFASWPWYLPPHKAPAIIKSIYDADFLETLYESEVAAQLRRRIGSQLFAVL